MPKLLLVLIVLTSCSQLQGSPHSESIYRNFYGDRGRQARISDSSKKRTGITIVNSSNARGSRSQPRQKYSRGRLSYAGNWGEKTYVPTSDERTINKPLMVENIRTILKSATGMMDELERVERLDNEPRQEVR